MSHAECRYNYQCTPESRCMCCFQSPWKPSCIRLRQGLLSCHRSVTTCSINAKSNLQSEMQINVTVTCACVWTNYTVSQKNDSDVAHYNFNAHQPNLLIFGRGVAERVHYQKLISYPTSPNECLCTT